ncbi:hypothetical protein HK405_001170, partial [Cladochytrium tenue]
MVFEMYPPVQRGGAVAKKITELALKTVESAGQNSQLALKLDTLLEDAGLEDVQEASCTAPVGWDGEVGELAIQDAMLTLEQLRRPFVALGGMTDAEFDQLLAAYRAECTARQAYFLWFNACGR